jgi:ABC-type polysaccharide/polyol phosphate transport system ATPase subunit
MEQMWLPIAVRLETTQWQVRERMRDAWAYRHDDAGVDEAVTKMIWLAAGIVVALGATAFFVSKYNQAKTNVPDPVGP